MARFEVLMPWMAAQHNGDGEEGMRGGLKGTQPGGSVRISLLGMLTLHLPPPHPQLPTPCALAPQASPSRYDLALNTAEPATSALAPASMTLYAFSGVTPPSTSIQGFTPCGW